MTNLKNLIYLAQHFGIKKNLAISTVGKIAANDGKFFIRLEAGKTTVTLARIERVLQWFSDNWPDDLEWPADIDRPPATPNPAPKTAFHCEGSGDAVMKGGT